jgi:predicted amidohydrolase YtcJ
MALLCAVAFVEASSAADRVFINGKIVTVDAAQTVASAMIVSDERILYVGDEEGARALAKESTPVVDLGGKMVLPGLIDSHTHPLSAAMIEFDHEIPDMRSVADVLAYVRARVEVVGEGKWIVIQQVFITRLEEKRYPTRDELDQAAPSNPVVFRTGPDASLNSRAITHFKIGEETQAPDGSMIERDANGEPTGILRGWNRIITLPDTGSRSLQEADRLKRLGTLFGDYNATGLTGIIDRNTSAEGMALYTEMEGNLALTVRVAMSRAVGNKESVDVIRERIRDIAKEPAKVMPSAMLRTVGIKMFLDGGMLTGSAFLREPWGTSKVYGITDPEYRGLRFIPNDKLEAAVDECAANDLQFTAHSVGDGAVHALLDAYARVAERRPIKHTRPNITHCNFMSAEAIRQMAKLGVSADIQPAWLYLDTRTLAQHFGEDRLTFFQPLRDIFRAGVIAGGGSDHMQKIGSLRAINPYHPFLGMWIAITRRARGYEGQLHPEQALDRMQALRFYTINNAYLMFLEKETGSLEVGKLADFIVIDRDYLNCPVDDIRRIRVRETWLAGRRVYSEEED